MGGMRFSKKRKIAGISMKAKTLNLSDEAWEKLDKMAGPESLASTTEELIKREYLRRERKMLSQQVQESSC